jgi:hypothetical protein
MGPLLLRLVPGFAGRVDAGVVAMLMWALTRNSATPLALGDGAPGTDGGARADTLAACDALVRTCLARDLAAFPPHAVAQVAWALSYPSSSFLPRASAPSVGGGGAAAAGTDGGSLEGSVASHADALAVRVVADVSRRSDFTPKEAVVLALALGRRHCAVGDCAPALGALWEFVAAHVDAFPNNALMRVLNGFHVAAFAPSPPTPPHHALDVVARALATRPVVTEWDGQTLATARASLAYLSRQV